MKIKDREVLEPQELENVSGGGNNKSSSEPQICKYCLQEYTGEWGKHMTQECPNNPYK